VDARVKPGHDGEAEFRARPYLKLEEPIVQPLSRLAMTTILRTELRRCAGF
jgi:hypothetical protein